MLQHCKVLLSMGSLMTCLGKLPGIPLGIPSGAAHVGLSVAIVSTY